MHELDSPERQAGSPGALSRWGSFPASSPPAYDQEKGKPKPKPKPIVPQELPGSTWINEHHPAYSGDDTSTPTEVTQPSPPRTPIQKATPTEPRSPVVSAITSRSGNQIVFGYVDTLMQFQIAAEEGGLVNGCLTTHKDTEECDESRGFCSRKVS
ncbi:hypothetical protein LTR67_009929 [Exophiala xenobiotica]